MKRPPHYRIVAYKPTTSDWYPSYQLADHESQALVRVSQVALTDGKHRVNVWGADDDGMERDFKRRRDARACFLAVMELPTVNHADLSAMGFVRA